MPLFTEEGFVPAAAVIRARDMEYAVKLASNAEGPARLRPALWE